MNNPLFRERVQEFAAQQLAVVSWLTECQLATLEGMNLVTRTTKSELARLQQICDKEVAQCKDLGLWQDILQISGQLILSTENGNGNSSKTCYRIVKKITKIAAPKGPFQGYSKMRRSIAVQPRITKENSNEKRTPRADCQVSAGCAA